jgi:hypothetical protein
MVMHCDAGVCLFEYLLCPGGAEGMAMAKPFTAG